MITKLRRDEITHAYVPEEKVEIFQIPTSPNWNGRYTYQLKNMPLYQNPSVFDIKFFDSFTSLTETAGVPNSGEYYVDYFPETDLQLYEASGIVTFHSSDAGKWCIAKYQEIGTIDIPELYEKDNFIINEQNSNNNSNFLIKTKYVNDYIVTIKTSTGIDRVFTTKLKNTYSASSTGLNSSFSVTLNPYYRTICEFSDLNKIHVFGITTGNAKFWRKSVNSADANDLGGYSNFDGSLPHFVQWASSVKVGNHLYIFGANTTVNNITTSTKSFRIELDTDVVEVLADLPGQLLTGSVSAEKDGLIYIFHNGQCWKYDILNNTYSNTIDLTGFLSISAFPVGTGNTETFLNNGIIFNGNDDFNILCAKIYEDNAGPLVFFQEFKYFIININSDFSKKLKSELLSEINEIYKNPSTSILSGWYDSYNLNSQYVGYLITEIKKNALNTTNTEMLMFKPHKINLNDN